MSVIFSERGLGKIFETAIRDFADDGVINYRIPLIEQSFDVDLEEIDNEKILEQVGKYIDLSVDSNIKLRVTVKDTVITAVMNKNQSKFDLSRKSGDLSVLLRSQVKEFNVQIGKIEVCQIKEGSCLEQQGVYFEISEASIDMDAKTPIDLLSSILMKDHQTHYSFTSDKFLSSFFPPRSQEDKALYQKYQLKRKDPVLKVNFQGMYIPAPELIINSRVIKLRTSGIVKLVHDQREYFAKLIVENISSFISTHALSRISSTLEKNAGKLSKRINIPLYSIAANSLDSKDFLRPVLDEIWYTQTDLILEGFAFSKHNQLPLVFDFSIDSHINKSKLETSEYLRNKRSLANRLDTKNIEGHYDMAFSISESFINAAIQNILKSGSLGELLAANSMPGVAFKNLSVNLDHVKAQATSQPSFSSVDNTYVHIIKDESIKIPSKEHGRMVNQAGEAAGDILVVIQTQLELSKVSNSWSHYFASKLENDLVWFPVEIRLHPSIVQKNGEIFLNLENRSDDNPRYFANTFAHPVKNMWGIVEKGIKAAFNEKLYNQLEKNYEFKLTEFFNIKGIELKPTSIQLFKSGHLSFQMDYQINNWNEFIEALGVEL